MSTATLPAVQNGAAHYQIDHAAVLKAIGINPRDPNAQALLLTCERYGLDPILKHAMLIQGRLYVTRDGLLHVAHKSGQFDGIEVVEQGETATHHTAKVSVYRKDMGRPFTYIGRYPKNGGNKAYGPEMAVKCGEVMALRRAFNVALCAREEAWDQEIETTATIAHEPEPEPSRAGRREINDAFPARDPLADFNRYLIDRMDQARKHWSSEMGIANVPASQQKHPDFQVPNVHQLVNHFVSHALETGAIKLEDVAKDGSPDTRDPAKAKAALAGIYARAPKRFRAAVDAYFEAKERELRPRLGMDEPCDPEPEDEAQEHPEDEAPVGREPGCDDV